MPKPLLFLIAGVVLALGVALGLLIPRHSAEPESGPPVGAGTNLISTNVLANAGTETNRPGESIATNAVSILEPSVEAGGSGPTNEVVVAAEIPTNAGPAVIDPSAAGSVVGVSDEASAEPIQLSFRGARIEMVIDWLAKTTGKSVVKHPRVNCQLTIVSSNKLTKREALNLVYRALSMEGCSTIESRNTILIVPEGQEPKMSPELLTREGDDIPDGRQPLLKVFPLRHVRAEELKERIKVVLSDKAAIDVDNRSNQLMVTDSTDNIRLLTELIKGLDVPSPGDTVVELYPLRHAEADHLANLLGLILNAKAGSGGGSSSASSGRSSASGGPSMPPGIVLPPGVSMPPSVESSGPAISSSTGAADSVRLWADNLANRLIVAAPRVRLPEIEELLEVLDQEKPQDVTLRVIALRHVSAEALVQEIAPLYQKMSGSAVKDTIQIAANSRANSIIILSSESNYRRLEDLLKILDTEEAQEKVMRAFPLRNADAEDVARQLEELNQDEESALSRYIYVYPPRPSSGSTKMSVVADRRRNTVIVQAPPGAMDNVAEMIRVLDEPVTDDSLAPRIFPLRYVSAVDIEDVLNELFLKKQQQRDYWNYYYDNFGQSTTDQNAGRLYGKVRITSEPYSNSIIVTSNSSENLSAIEAVLKQLDVPSQAGETTFRLELRFAQAIEVAKSINILFASAGSPPLRPVNQPGVAPEVQNQQQPPRTGQSGFELEKEEVEEAYYPWIGGQQENARSLDGRSATRPISDLVGRVRIVPDRRSNSLMITSNVHLLPQVLKLVADLDVPTPQVMLEARIVAVSSDFREKLGVRWSPDGSQVFSAEDLDDSLLVGASAQYREVFLGSALPDSLRTGILDSTVNLDFLIQFLRKNTELKVLAEPQLNVADNEIGRLFVGAQVPFLSSSLNTDVGGRNDSYQYRDVGIILELTPYINNDSDVTLRVRIESSNIRDGELLFGGAILDTRDFRTEVTVRNGETLVLGGIHQTEHSKTIRKVPLLGDIPVLGYLFKKRDTASRELELLVFLRPRVTRSPKEAQELLREVQQRTPLIQEWTSELRANESPVDAPHP